MRNSSLIVMAALTPALILSTTPDTAKALGIDIVNLSSTGASTTTLAPGDILTVDLVVNNDDALPVYGLQLVAAGYDVDSNGVADDGLTFLDGVGADSVLNGTIVPDPNDPFGLTPLGGLQNLRTTPREWRGRSRNPANDELVFHGLGVDFVAGVSLTPTNGDGSMDVGIGGQLISEGDVHFRLRFLATPQVRATQMTLVFGLPLDPWGGLAFANPVVGPSSTTYDFDNDYLNLLNESLVVTVVPEPGTALLLGLGLTVLGMRRQGRR